MSEQTLTKQADEKFCSSCGAIVKIAAEICPKCGVRQNKKSAFKRTFDRKVNWKALFYLSFWLGYFGIDRFYAGKTGTGILKLLTGGGWGIWWIIDIFKIVNGTFTDASGKLVEKQGVKASKHFCISVGILTAYILILFGVIYPSIQKTNIQTRSASQTSSTVSQPTKNTKVPVAELSATQLSNAYENNEIAADKTYKNKWIKVSGVVQNIGKDIKGNSNIVLGDLYEGAFFVRVHFKDNNEIVNLRKGQEITVVGQCQGMLVGEIGATVVKVIIIEKAFFEE